MTTKIRDLVDSLATLPKPVLCLDTCDLFHVIRGIRMEDMSNLRAFIRIRNRLDLITDRCQIVVTYLVVHEWRQNFDSVRVNELADLKKTVDRHRLINEARQLVGMTRLEFPDLEQRILIDHCIAVTRNILDQAAVLEQDRECIDRALGRVLAQKRPSHHNMIKDSIHLEHYLELSRQLKAAGFSKPCYFVSSNKADFWAEKDKPRIHPVLEPEMVDAGLLFESRLERAVDLLGI